MAHPGVTAVPDAPDAWPTVAPRFRAARGEAARWTFSMTVEVVTPILGGSSRTREVDEFDVIRPATIRGNLRFWWRALHGHHLELDTSGRLYEAEAALWGRAATDAGGRSPIELRIDDVEAGEKDSSPRLHWRTAYALWPAVREPVAPKWQPVTRFRLTVSGPEGRDGEVRDAVRAWILFGGYGGRTRRGLGSLLPSGDPAGWLPTTCTRTAFEELFGRDLFAPPGREPVDTPWLAGAALHAGRPVRDATTAWTTALNWLKEFRQRPGWPEAGLVRRLTAGDDVAPAWPRAALGLPIQIRFKNEPSGRRLTWRLDDGSLANRLASPLVVKALPVVGGLFAPCALWLHRAYPSNGEVVLQGDEERSAASFDGSLRSKFLDWLHQTHHTTVLAS